MLVAIVWIMAISAAGQQIAGARQQATAACEAVASRYSLSRPLSGAAGSTDLMHAVLDVVLAQEQSVEGGFWTTDPAALAEPRGAISRATPGPGSGAAGSALPTGFLAYAFPTYQGSGIKRDIPEAETPLILRTLRTASATHTAVADVIRSGPDAVVAAACPVKDEPALFAWMLTRARPPLGPRGALLVAGLAAVLAVILVVAVALAVALRRWKRNLNRLESALSLENDVGPAGQLPRLHEPELDGIVDALNRYAKRAESLRQRTAELGHELARAERFSVLGKLAAQVAHEIRNPVGAMRLKAENALAGDTGRQQAALHFILEQIGRIESQVASLLALTQPVTIAPQKVNVAEWLASIVDSHRELAHQRRIRLMRVTRLDELAKAPLSQQPEFDAEQLRRALDNLLLNALRHAGEGGMVTVTVQHDWPGGRPHLRITVFDNGWGVPADQRERVFEPFVTGRPDGSGLGLAVVAEVASAHGGRAWIDDTPTGASFVIEIPWQQSS